MGLYMEHNGFYYIRVERGKEVIKFSCKTKDEKLATDIYSAFLKELTVAKVAGKLRKSSDGVFYDQINAPVPERQAPALIPQYEKYIETNELKKLSGSAMIFKRQTLKKLRELKITSYSQINQDTANAFLRYISSYAPDTQKKFVSELKTFLHWSIKHEYIDERTVARLEFPRFKVTVDETIINEEDFRMILDHLESKKDFDFAMYLKTLYYTGSRPSEVVPLRVDHFNFTDHSATIYQHKVGKKKIAYLPEFFSDELSAYIQENGITEFIFKGYGKQDEYYGKKFKDLKDRLSLNSRYTLYTIRHTAATNLLTESGDLEAVSRQLGHSDIKMTAKHYTHRGDSARKSVINKNTKKI